MTVLDIKHPNVQGSNQHKQEEKFKTKFFRYVKITVIHLLILAPIAVYLYGHMQTERLSMEKEVIQAKLISAQEELHTLKNPSK